MKEFALTVGDPEVLRARLRTAERVVVAGGGLTGIETAAELAERYPQLEVRLVSGGTVGPDLSPRAAKYLHEWMTAHHVGVREHARIARVLRDGVELASGEVVPADVVIWCGSFTVSPMARDAGLRVNERGQILVDEHLRSSDPSIFAIGDAAAFADLRMGCATAMPMGAYVADFLAGATTDPYRFAYVAVCISLGRNEGLIQLKNADDSPRESSITGRAGAWVKELVCRYTMLAIKLEAMGIPYAWLKEAAA